VSEDTIKPLATFVVKALKVHARPLNMAHIETHFKLVPEPYGAGFRGWG
jgi:hypothetical protein